MKEHSKVAPQRARAIIVGGSIGGLSAALLLRDLGFDVDVYERSADKLKGRGGGIVLQPETLRWFRERSSQRPDQIATTSSVMRYFDRDDAVVFEEEVEWRFTSWGTLYRALLADYGSERYTLGETAADFTQTEREVAVRFSSGRVEHADLVIFADGVGSAMRRALLPEVSPTYAGYVGWRGSVPETELSPRVRAALGDALTYSMGPNTHIVAYPIPGRHGGIEVGQRQINYVWYRNVPAGAALDDLMTDTSGTQNEVSVPPGRVQDRYIAEMKSAAKRDLAPVAAELVNATDQPYLQAVMDVAVPRLVFGRAVLIGDAGFVARPHAAAGTAKAAAEAWALAEHLSGESSIPAALGAWEPEQLSVGHALIERVTRMGERAQFEESWEPTDPDLRFGLRGGALTPSWE